ncbi:SET domain-containing protein, partial [Peniophora sp. CONT]
FVYDDSGRLREDVQDNLPIHECNAFCGCPASCPNRVTQRGRKYGIQLKHTGSKGYGVFAREKIPAHTYVGTFAGELIPRSVAEGRIKWVDFDAVTHQFAMNFWYIGKPRSEKPSDGARGPIFVMDASRAGNFTRFVNHSCSPNCRVLPLYVDEQDERKPLLTFWTRQTIAAGDEITISY